MSVPLVIPSDLRSQVAKIARNAKAKRAEVYRLAIRCGLPEAEKRLGAVYVCPPCGRVELFIDGIGEEFRPH